MISVPKLIVDVKEPQHRLVQILFGDAQCIDRMFADELSEELKKSNMLAPYYVVGYLVAETEETLVLVSTILPEVADEGEEYRRISVIPKRQVLEVQEALMDKSSSWKYPPHSLRPRSKSAKSPQELKKISEA